MDEERFQRKEGADFMPTALVSEARKPHGAVSGNGGNGHGRRESKSTSVQELEGVAPGILGLDGADLFDLVPQPTVVMDRNHTILHLNQAAAQVAGRSIEACIGVKLWDLFDNPGCRAGTCAASQAMNTGKVCDGEALPVVQGKQIAVRVTATPVFDDRRQVIGVLELIYPVESSMKVSNEILRLAKETKEGKLSVRANLEGFDGLQSQMLENLNTMLDAILLPIGEGNRVLSQISGGKIDELITQNYKGDHEKMKLAVNNVAQVTQGLQKEMARLIEASKEGQLSDRGKPEQFQGAYAEIVRGVNTTLLTASFIFSWSPL